MDAVTQKADSDKKYVTEFAEKIGKLQCNSCSGWGHVTTCYRNGKNKHKDGCPTQDLLDIIYKLKLFNRVEYIQLLA